jgi:hypothetical protein
MKSVFTILWYIFYGNITIPIQFINYNLCCSMWISQSDCSIHIKSNYYQISVNVLLFVCDDNNKANTPSKINNYRSNSNVYMTEWMYNSFQVFTDVVPGTYRVQNLMGERNPDIYHWKCNTCTYHISG